MSGYHRALCVGGYLNFAIGLAHLAVFLGLFFAMEQLNALTETVGVHISTPGGGWAGWIKLLLMIIALAGFVSVLGLYGFSGAGRIRHMPFLRTGLLFTAALFTGHGAYQILEKFGKYQALIAGKDVHPLLGLIPLWKLTIGILYLVGTIGMWKSLAASKKVP